MNETTREELLAEVERSRRIEAADSGRHEYGWM